MREAMSKLDWIDAGETETLDCKEEPGRRGDGGVIGPSATKSDSAGFFLAKELCCLANHEGGTLIYGGHELAFISTVRPSAPQPT